MKLSSSVFENGGEIPAKFTCKGANISPPLLIERVPTSAKSLALIMDDPDTPSGGWVHWLVWNIDPRVTEILDDVTPFNSIEGMTDFGTVGYGGPCPPSGVHHYNFKIYALDIVLDLPAQSIKEDMEQAMEGHILDQAVLVGLFGS